MRKIYGCLILLFLAVAGFAQNKDYVKKPTVALFFGANDFLTAQRIRSSSLSSVLSNKSWANVREIDAAFGVSYLQGLNEMIDYSFNFSTSALEYPIRDNASNSATKEYFLHTLDASLHVKLLTDKYAVVPYLSAGLGGSYWRKRFEAFAPVGMGLQIKLIPDYFFFSNFQYRLPVTAGANYHFFYNIGFGGSVAKEKAPEVKPVPVAPPPPPPAPKPVDSDGDGINDPEDKCPTVAGVAKYQGCPVPDTDGDGINDEQDKCPTVKGTAKYQGCPIPDSDGDGINDENDKCPSVAGLPKYQGCPIPDSDGDGINDEEDKCPAVVGVAEFKGCPAPKNFNAANVLFATGSATLINVGKSELNKMVPLLQENPDVKMTISGHTDNTGSATVNQKLSENRAGSVKKYLVSKGIAAERITAVGYGATKPVADNKTPAGRTKNRRVEFTID